MNDIDLSDSDGSPSEWIPVGQYTDKTPNGYAGSFDGGGFTVSGYIVASADAVSADKDGSLAAGFFGLAGQSAKIRGLTVSGVVSVDIGNDGIDIHAGGIAGRNNGGTISDCVSGGEVSASGGGGDHNSYAGGIAGDNDSGTITGCANNGEVSISYGFQNYAGGIAGDNDKGTITDCAHYGGDVSASGGENNYAGGITGDNDGKIINCAHYDGDVLTSRDFSSYTNHAGGIAGVNSPDGTIINCAHYGGEVSDSGSSNKNMGGIAGTNSPDGTIINCAHYGGKVTASGSGSKNMGGIAGYNNGRITNCAHYGDVSASGGARNRAGGIVGYNFSDGTNDSTITNCAHYGGKVTASGGSGYNRAGGIAGYNNKGTITNCAYGGGEVSASGTEDAAGGIAGYNTTTDNPNGVNISNSCWPVSGDFEAVGSGDKGTDAVSADVASLDAAEMQMAVTTVLPAKRTLPVALGGYAPALVSYPGKADDMTGYLSVSGDIYVASPDIAGISRGWPCAVSGKKIGVTAVSFDIDLRATDFGSLRSDPKPIAAGCAAAPLAFSVAVSSISLDNTTLELTVGEKQILIASVEPVDAKDEIKWKSTSTDITAVDNKGEVTAVKRGKATITASARGVTASCDVTVFQKIESPDVTLSPDVFIYDGNKKEPKVTVTVSGDTLVESSDYTLVYDDNTEVGEATATVTGIKSNYYSGTVIKDFTILPKPASPDVTDKTRTDADGSGVLVVEPNTTEEFAVYDALGRLSFDKALPDNISADAKAVQPGSA
ncbi:Ig-like domain-containing protein, partial [Cloacibacillus sp.]|uniref:Ig-like domain-containing protein n=1 Tax=Cloacibacillus sp. TaxID=2049023 RepID=UPI0025C082B0